MKQIIEKLRSRHTYMSLTSEEANKIADVLEECVFQIAMLGDLVKAKDGHIAQLETELLMLKSK